EAEHAILVETLDCPRPHARRVRVSNDVTQLREAATAVGDHTGLPVIQEISLEQAGVMLADAVYRPHADADPESQAFLPIVRRRVEGLPEREGAGETGYTRADRVGAVEQFLAEAGHQPGVDPAVLRFWAQVVCGRTASYALPPTRIGPRWLDHVLTEYVPHV